MQSEKPLQQTRQPPSAFYSGYTPGTFFTRSSSRLAHMYRGKITDESHGNAFGRTTAKASLHVQGGKWATGRADTGFSDLEWAGQYGG